jgi:hypothetical protein
MTASSELVAPPTARVRRRAGTARPGADLADAILLARAAPVASRRPAPNLDIEHLFA